MSAAPATLESLGLMRRPHHGAVPDGVTPVTGLAVDSRDVQPGFVFVAIKGGKLDGAEFAQYAVRQGAVAVVTTEEGVATARSDLGALPVPFFTVIEPRAELARLAALTHPGQPPVMAAVTGTNGKTSVAHFTRQLWAALGHAAAAFGTTGIEGEGFEAPLAMTTPEPITLHHILSELATKGCTHAAMEASSHGLAQYRLHGVQIAAAGLTNITRDHMDYHADHDDYVGAKMRLFHEVLNPSGAAVLNADDPAFALARMSARGARVIAVGKAESADLRLVSSRFHTDGQDIAFTWQGSTYDARLDLIGAFQASNAMIAAGLAIACGDDPAAIFAALPKLTGAKGRMERVARRANGASVFVDYAHTPDALSTALTAIRPHVTGRLVVVGGAGGDRDPGKRPLMGQAMTAHADVVIVTDDNPRSEDPASIRAAVRQGAPDADDIGDRAEAILTGVDWLTQTGDCLLIVGKGHEQGQERDGAVLPFDDAEQARTAVAVLDRDQLGGLA
ncbi:MAG: UDP-N-acetylmuramoyl-L-alanyl-D-glutamate--2,6-diaminopimelate ligase [Pseudomonadota bacterium]